MKTNKNIIVLDGKEIINSIKIKYGESPIFSSKYETVKKAYLNNKNRVL